MPASAAPTTGTRIHTLTRVAIFLAARIIDENARAPMPAKTPRAAAAARSLKVMGGVPATVSSAAVP